MTERTSKEMREYLVKLLLEDGRKSTELAYEYGVKQERIRDWVRTHKKKLEFASNPELSSSAELKKRIAALEKNEKELKEENEILKKSMHIFTKNHT